MHTPAALPTVVLPRPPGFSLRAAADFYAGFVPCAGMATSPAPDRLTLAFRLDGTFEAVAVELVEDASTLRATFAGTRDARAVSAQISRMLGLDEGGEWLALGRRDRRVGDLQCSFPGFYTAAKPSPYDAAAWGVIAPRMDMRAAAKLKRAIARDHGDVVELHGTVHSVFPGPEGLLRMRVAPGLSEEKVARLHGVAVAALEGRLEVARLRAMGEAAALADLMTLRGVGPWTAAHIYFRGAAPTDALPLAEPRVLHGFAETFGEPPTEAAFVRAAEAWRPYRMWVCILLARHLMRIGGWRRHGLSTQRAAASKRAARSAPTSTSP